MKEFLEFLKFLKDSNIIPLIKKKYKNSLKSKDIEELLQEIIEHLLNLRNTEDISNLKEYFSQNKIDLIGYVYQKIVSIAHRKRLGEFYTPIHIVNYILNGVGYTVEGNIDSKKLIDISCGSGSFIIQAIKVLIKHLLSKFKTQNISDLTVDKAKKIIKIIIDNVYGIDINPIACILCQINIYLTIFELLKVIIKADENYELPMFNIEDVNALELSLSYKYDYIVGNPPYLFIRDIPRFQRNLIEASDFKTNKGQYDYFQIFIEMGIRILKNKGILGYVVPDSLLVLSNRHLIRKYVYDNVKIREIYYMGPQFEDPIVSNIIIILQKESDETKRLTNLIQINHHKKRTEPNKINQKIIEKWNYRFLINLNDLDSEIIEFLNINFPELNDLNDNPNFKIDIWRGVELGKNGKVIFCNTCNKYFPLPKNNYICKECKTELNNDSIESIIIKSIKSDLKNKYKPFLYSINRYKVKELKYINTTKQGINYKELNRYENRVIVRQLAQNSLICATYDKGSLTSQSLYNLKILKSPITEFNNYYILGLLNSQLLAFYFIKSFGSYKKLFPRILIQNLKCMPIAVPEIDIEKKISREIIIHVKTILKLDKFDIEHYTNLQNKISSLVFDLYRITNEQRNYISDVLKNL